MFLFLSGPSFLQFLSACITQVLFMQICPGFAAGIVTTTVHFTSNYSRPHCFWRKKIAGYGVNRVLPTQGGRARHLPNQWVSLAIKCSNSANLKKTNPDAFMQ
jgi:hypothetical protein